MSDWSNGATLQFLKYYRGEPTIWDPTHCDHKDKKKVADAWSRISISMNRSVKDLKNKKDILMIIFRKHFKRKQESIRSGAGIEDIYEPIWFGYKLMESFLLPIYTVKWGKEAQSRLSERGVVEIIDETEEAENDNSLMGPSTSAPLARKKFVKSRRRPDLAEKQMPSLAEKQMARAFSQLTDLLSQRRSNTDYDDECDLYGKLVAKKIRELPNDDRKLIMYEIDGLFIERIKREALERISSPLPPPDDDIVILTTGPNSPNTEHTEFLKAYVDLQKNNKKE